MLDFSNVDHFAETSSQITIVSEASNDGMSLAIIADITTLLYPKPEFRTGEIGPSEILVIKEF